MSSKYNRYIFPTIMLVLTAIFLFTSLINLRVDMRTWILETFAVIAALIILPITMKRFRLTNLLYILIFLHSLILDYGAHYSYSDVPLGFWVSNLFGWKRNNYDKLGHFMQGFCPVMIAREIISRLTPIKRGGWLALMSWCVAMTITALYEIFEWLCSLTDETHMEAFLGTQGYVYDTQSDMGMCLVGATVALIVFTHLHNHQLSKLEEEEKELKAQEEQEKQKNTDASIV